MKFKNAFLFFTLLVFFAAGQMQAQTLKTEKDKTSYALGKNIGDSFKTQGIEINAKIFLKGLNDGIAGKKSELTNNEIRDLLLQLQQQTQSKMKEKSDLALLKNQKKEKAFLESNNKKKNIITTDSGLQYEILKKGKGEKPLSSDRVKTHYQGSLLDGTVFDSSYKRGQPAVFGVNQVIKGWTEALQLMPVGSKWKLYIPAALAYGNNPPRGSKIEPGSTLIFEIELLEIEK